MSQGCWMVVSGLFEVIRKKAVAAYFNAKPIICLEDLRITPKTLGHCARKL